MTEVIVSHANLISGAGTATKVTCIRAVEWLTVTIRALWPTVIEARVSG